MRSTDRIAAVIGVCTLLCASVVLAAAGTADAPGPKTGAAPQAALSPSIEILAGQSHLAGTCGGPTFDLTTFINVDAQASADVKLSTAGVGTLEDFVDETGSNIGPFKGTYSTFHILAFGGGLPPNTPIQLTITTYPSHALSGTASYFSSVTFDCTTGAILNLVASAPGIQPPIPALNPALLVVVAALVALLGGAALRLRPPVRSPRSNRRP